MHRAMPVTTATSWASWLPVRGSTSIPGWLSARAIFVRMVSAKALTSPRKSCFATANNPARGARLRPRPPPPPRVPARSSRVRSSACTNRGGKRKACSPSTRSRPVPVRRTTADASSTVAICRHMRLACSSPLRLIRTDQPRPGTCQSSSTSFSEGDPDGSRAYIPSRKTNSHFSLDADHKVSRRPTRQTRSVITWIPSRVGITNHRTGRVSARVGTAILALFWCASVNWPTPQRSGWRGSPCLRAPSSACEGIARRLRAPSHISLVWDCSGCRDRRVRGRPCEAAPFGGPGPQPVERQVHDRGCEQGQELTRHEPADDRDTERLAQLRPDAGPGGQRHRSENRGEGRHHDRPEPQPAGLEDRLLRRAAALALGDECVVDHHDGVLLDD